MKILLAREHGDWSTAHSGKGFFAQRLVDAMRKQGAEVTSDVREKVDVALHIGHIRYESRARVNVLRVGPARVSTHENYAELNHIRRKSMKLADGIIYQSDYSKQVQDEFAGTVDKPFAVIYNGADPEFYAGLSPMVQSYKWPFLASTRKWIAQKRLKDIIESFQMAEIPDSCLYVTGETLGQEKPYRKVENVRFTGPLDQTELGQFYRMATALVHIVYLDACPNSVVEAVCAGCPVICTDQGGTKEVAQCGQHVIIPDKQFKFKPVNLNKPPRIDHQVLANAMVDMTVGQQMDTPEVAGLMKKLVSIDYTAHQYLKFFERLLA
jgi:glycosyltransferase involved in cell wall biosynthesis